MPVLVNILSPDHHLFARSGRALAEHAATSSDCINIGLVNSMPDSALVATERQLFDLLDAAAGSTFNVRLHLYAMSTTPRGDWGRDYIRRFYCDTKDLCNANLNGLIVTGAEPGTASLTDEPYWRSFRQVIDWAQENTASSICSCLAVHGAAFHLDGIERRPLAEKCIGVFAQSRMMDHPLMRGVPLAFDIPHSRSNEVCEHPLAQSGYTILSRSAAAGADTFVKQHRNSLFVFFQGHPEYETQSLLGEYRRDIGRFLRRESQIYPTMPKGYFDSVAEDALTAFRCQVFQNRSPELFNTIPIELVAKGLRNSWRAVAACIYHNWIAYLAGASATKAHGSKR